MITGSVGFAKDARAGRASVIGEADDCASGIEAAETLNPDAILLDILLPDGSGSTSPSPSPQSTQPSLGRADVEPKRGRPRSALTDTPAHGFIARAT